MRKWSELLSNEILQLSDNLIQKTAEERQNGRDICPPQDMIFRALQLTPPEQVKVCIVGQDPYPTPGVANGLAFSIANGTKIQPSLSNIYKELVSDLEINYPTTTDLGAWATKGVLLLNATLTTYANNSNSHVNWGWQKFTSAVLQATHQLPQPIVYILWGSNAQSLMKDLVTCAMTYIEDRHIAIERLLNKAYILSSHPSPLGAHRNCKGSPPFMGSKPFSTANKLLIDMGGEPVDWAL